VVDRSRLIERLKGDEDAPREGGERALVVVELARLVQPVAALRLLKVMMVVVREKV